MADWTSNYSPESEKNLYAIYRSQTTLKVWNGSAMVAFVDADRDDYDVPAEYGGGGVYGHTTPTGLPSGDTYLGFVYVRAGATPDVTDTKLSDEKVITKGVTVEDDDDEPADFDEAIEQVAMGPKRVTGDSGSIEQHSLSELMEYKRQQAAIDAAASGNLGIKFTKLIPPGQD